MSVATLPARRTSALVVVTAVLLLLLGLSIGLGGARLAALGGSKYYLVAGIWLVVVAIALVARHGAALLLYGAFLLVTTAWAVFEVGLDWWQLVPRVAWWWLIAVWLAMPWMTRRLARAQAPHRAPAALLWCAIGLGVVLGAATAFVDKHGIVGELPMDAVMAPPAEAVAMARNGDWPAYGGSAGGLRYAPLSQITPQNVGRLKVAWRYRTGDRPGPDDPTEITDENTPLKIGDLLYVCTPHSRVIALDARTGEERWKFDPHLVSIEGFKHFEHMTCRGVSYHDEAAYAAAPDQSGPSATVITPAAATRACAQRIFLPTADARLIALDAHTGVPCADFGVGGTVDLRTSIGPFKPGGYYSTSPAAVTRNLVIIGGHVSDNVSNNEPSGVIRAFDVHDGHLMWAWDSGRPEQSAPLPAGQIYTRNSPNMWSVFSTDEALGMIYLPMGNQTPDQWGGERTAASESVSAGVVALDIATGAMRWHYQFTHHDLWDMDVGGQPTLVDIKTASGEVPALVASTKQGSIYVLDRRTGEPVVPITEVPRPQRAGQGDRTAPSQPLSALNFSPPDLTESSMWGATPYDQLWCRIRFRSLRYEGMFTPPSEQGSLVYPGNFGVFDWGGISVDPTRQLLIANPDYMAFTSRLVPKTQGEVASTAPTSAQLAQAPGVSTRVWDFLGWRGPRSGQEATSENNGIKHVAGIPYDFELMAFLSPLGIPCQAPPWGYVAGVDLRTHRIAWQHKNGTIRDSSPIPLPFALGVPSLGGTVVTAGGVAFLTGTLDNYVRAYDVRDGRKLWQSRLPAGGQATPMSYADATGKQYVLVTAGGHGSLGTKSGDYVIAYTLPDQ
ncbi:MAG: glucose/quinate/shikimate family membrane-bound PQQ-dependent dehydrogenase [Rhodocyclaceae bacterium]